MSQLLLPQRMGFQVSPGIMSMDSLLQKLYPPERGPYLFRRGPGVSGLGCNPGETRDVAGGGQMICGDDGKSWSPYTAPPPPPVVSGTPVYNPPTGYTPGGGPSEPNCTISAGGLTWVDNACVAAQSQRSDANQEAIAAAQSASELQQCLDNAALNAGKPGGDPSVCYSRYPGVTPSGNVGQPPVGSPPPAPPAYTPPSNPTPPSGYVKPNQSVPPTTPLVPMNTGFQNTGQVVASQLGQGAANPPASNPASGSGDTLLIVAAVGVGLYLLMKGGKS